MSGKTWAEALEELRETPEELDQAKLRKIAATEQALEARGTSLDQLPNDSAAELLEGMGITPDEFSRLVTTYGNQPEGEAEAKPEEGAAAEGETKPEGEAEAKPDGETKPEGEAAAKPEGETKPEGEAKPEAEAKPEGEAEAKPDGETKPEGDAAVPEAGTEGFTDEVKVAFQDRVKAMDESQWESFVEELTDAQADSVFDLLDLDREKAAAWVAQEEASYYGVRRALVEHEKEKLASTEAAAQPTAEEAMLSDINALVDKVVGPKEGETKE